METGIKEIKVFARNGAWVADFGDDARIQELFGTTEIETPFMTGYPIENVIAELSERNPGFSVTWSYWR